MSELKEFLTKTKSSLLSEKTFLQCLSKKYAIPGYISVKNIRGNKSEYLQFKDTHYRLVSVYLSKDKKKLCKQCFDSRQDLEKRLHEIEEDLTLLDNIQCSNSMIVSYEHNEKILENAMGISPGHNLLFYLQYSEENNCYVIHYYGKKQIHTVNMIYVNESSIDKIADYMTTAGLIVDNDCNKQLISSHDLYPAKSKKQPTVSRTNSGIKYSFKKNSTDYTITFYHQKEKYELQYEPYFSDSSSKFDAECARMGFFVEKYINQINFEKGVSKYYERRQNVHTET